MYSYDLKITSCLIVEALRGEEFTFTFFIKKNDIFQLTIHYNKKRIIISCLHKLLPFSIQYLCEFFTTLSYIEKPTKALKELGEFYTGRLDSSYFINYNNYLIYNKFLSLEKYIEKMAENNCLILVNALTTFKNIFFKNFNINLIKLNLISISSFSFYIYFKFFNIKKIEKWIKKEEENYIRDSYFGGRCEVFGNKKENEKIFYFDFSGMYASCMLEKNVYGRPELVYDKTDFTQPGFYNITWYSCNNNKPILPHHNLINNKLLFTNGYGAGTYWFEEIILFKKYGGKVLKINSALIYKNFDYLFNDFINYFNDLKTINPLCKTLSKLIINSFYGKCALKPNQEIFLFIHNDEEFKKINQLHEDKLIKINKLDEINTTKFVSIILERNTYKILFENKFIFQIHKEKCPNIAIASSVAAKARIKLYEAFISVEKNNGRVLYCDTDSIFAAYQYDVYGQQHGNIKWDLKSNDSIILDGLFLSPKTYSLQFTNQFITKIKGVNRNYLSFETIKQKINSNEKILNCESPNLYTKNFVILKKLQKKKIKLLAYDKRLFQNNLLETIPFYHLNGVYSTGI